MNWPPADRTEWTDFDHWWFRHFAAKYPGNDAVTIQVRNVAREAFFAGQLERK